MNKGLWSVGLMSLLLLVSPAAAAEAPLGGFIPFVGISLSDEFDTYDDGADFFIGDVAPSYVGSSLGSGFSDIALLDTGAGTHIITQTAAGASGFNIAGEGFAGLYPQEIFGATGGSVNLLIDDPLGIFAAGLGDRVSAGSNLVMDPNDMRGQTSIALLEGDSSWTLPNILGLPMAAQHGIMIRNDQPQIFQYQGRTMRTPQVEFIELGTGDEQGILRRTDLTLEPSGSFTSGPFYQPSFEIDPNFNINFHNNPASPTVIDSGGIYVEADVLNNGISNLNVSFLFDTGADLTVVSEGTALDMGYDVLIDEPDFVVEVEGAGGVASEVPGFYADELTITANGGSVVLEHVPMVVLDVPNPLSPANIIDAIIGMHIFAGRNLVIDAAPAALIPGAAPKLYISDPVTETHQWATAAASANWSTAGNWSPPGDPNAGDPGSLWIAQAANVSGSDQTAMVTSDSTVFQLAVSGSTGANMRVQIGSGATLTTFGEALIEADGEIHLDGGKLDSQVVNIEEGTLSGSGTVFVGTGPIDGVVRNLSGLIAPDGAISITGDLSNLVDATIALDLFTGGNDKLEVSRNAFLNGTLEVSLQGGFEPTVGQMFTLLTYGNLIEENFAELILPFGYDWDLSVNGLTNSLVLEMIAITSIPGDFDGNMMVNAADLALWEAGFGQPGGYTGADFLDWQKNLGYGTLSTIGVVPEPGTTTLFALCLGIGATVSRRKTSA